MKKIFLLLAMVLFSVNVFADSRSCKVYGMDGVTAYVESPTYTADDRGNAFVLVKLSSTNDTGREIRVAVNCYDIRGKYIHTKEIEINNGENKSGTWFNNLEKGMVYQFKINSASCQ